MPAPRTRSITLTIGIIVVLVQSLALGGMGTYILARFFDEAEQGLEARARMPGLLMNRQLLRYESVADREIMTELAGDEFLEGMVVGADDTVYYATRPEHVGRSVALVPGLDPSWFAAGSHDPVLLRWREEDQGYLVSVTPVIPFPGGAPVFYAYTKLRTDRTEGRKGEAVVFVAGLSLAGLALTSLAILLIIRVTVARPLLRLTEAADRLARGRLDQPFAEEPVDEVGSLSRSLAAMRDAIQSKIAELTAANRALEEEQKRTQAFLDALPDIAFVVDPEGRYLEVLSPARNNLYGDGAALRGRLLNEVLPPDPAEKIMATVAQAARTRAPQVLEYAFDLPAGQRWFEGRSSAIRGRDGKVEAVVWVARDITQRKAMEERLRQAKDEAERISAQLRELDAMKSAFLSSVSHELRTPLTSLLGFAKLSRKKFARHFLDLAWSDPDLTRQARQILDNLDILSSEGERLTRLINDVLDLTKIESGRVEWQDREVDPGDLAREVADMARGWFEQLPDVEFAVELEPALPPVRVDPDRLKQVLLNLLSNAVKFTDRGHVRLRARADGPGQVEFAVEDTGLGIPEEEQARVFEVFHQAHQNEADKPRGTGLGLTISRQIVEHYGGSIALRSTPGRGSTFMVLLPAARPTS
ncbi:MAG: ATP-binding protein [Thermodesulfobacteriota bacterium]